MGLLDSVIGALGDGERNAQPGSASGVNVNNNGGNATTGAAGSGLGGILAGLGGAGGSALLNAVVAMLSNGQHAQGGGVGGLSDLIARFGQHGLGDVIGSWIGTGQNQPISAGQVSSVLGEGGLAQIAQQLGLTHDQAAEQVSKVLPEAVDRLTPNGQAPSGGLGDMGSILSQLSGH